MNDPSHHESAVPKIEPRARHWYETASSARLYCVGSVPCTTYNKQVLWVMCHPEEDLNLYIYLRDGTKVHCYHAEVDPLEKDFGVDIPEDLRSRKKKYRPYTVVEAARDLLGRAIVLGTGEFLVAAIKYNAISDWLVEVGVPYESWKVFTADELLKYATHTDGSPCGVEVVYE